MITLPRFRYRMLRSLSLTLSCILLVFYSGNVVQGQFPIDIQAEKNPVSGGANYFPFADIEKVIQKWSADQHLYVQGNLGLSDSQLMKLESWLQQNGPHWTVILMEDASQQRYVNEEGRVETNMDAVELSISDLMELGSFTSQIHPVSGEQDGAVFILFLKQRKFSYRSSDAQRRRGLGQDRWIGKLDRSAFRAMRGGGRILDAVRDTVSSINKPLSRAIVSEQKIAEQKRLQRQRKISEMLARLKEVENKIGRIQSSAATVKQAHPNSTADMTQPDIVSITKQVSEIRANLKQENASLGKIQKTTNQANNASDDWINLYREYEGFEVSEKQLQQRKEQLEKDTGDLRSKLSTSFSNVDKMLAEALSLIHI